MTHNGILTAWFNYNSRLNLSKFKLSSNSSNQKNYNVSFYFHTWIIMRKMVDSSFLNLLILHHHCFKYNIKWINIQYTVNEYIHTQCMKWMYFTHKKWKWCHSSLEVHNIQVFFIFFWFHSFRLLHDTENTRCGASAFHYDSRILFYWELLKMKNPTVSEVWWFDSFLAQVIMTPYFYWFSQWTRRYGGFILINAKILTNILRKHENE